MTSAQGHCRVPRALWVAGMAAVALAVSGCASPPALTGLNAPSVAAPTAPVASAVVAVSSIAVAGATTTPQIPLEWHSPPGPIRGLVALQHGFTRHCAHLRALAQALAAQGLMTACVQRASLTSADDWVRPLVRWIADERSRDPWGRELPHHVVLAGHSAGALLALRLGAAWSTVEAEPARRKLVGAVLFDPVGSRQWVNDLLAVSSQGNRPVRAIKAQTSPCNARLSAWPGLQALRRDLLARGQAGDVGVQLTVRSTHMDAEGPTSDALARWACGGHDPTPENFEALTQWTLRWIDEMMATAGEDATKNAQSGAPVATASPPVAAPWRPIE